MIIYTERHNAAPPASIESTCERLGITSDSWIVAFWKKNNGALFNDLLLIYSTDDIAERNSTFEIDAHFKQMIAIGDDSGGRMILIKKNGKDGFFLVDMGSASLENSEQFESLEDVLRELINEKIDVEEDLGDIVTIGACKPTPEEVLGVKKMLGVGFSVAQLKAMLCGSGHIIISNVHFHKYRDALAKFSSLIKFK